MTKENTEGVQLNKIMHEVYSTINSIKQLLDNSLINIDKYNFDKKVLRDDLVEISDLMNYMDTYLQYWQSTGEGADYYNHTNTNPDFPIYDFFERPNRYYQKRLKKFRLVYQFDSNLPRGRFPYVEAYPTLSAIPNILFDNAVKYSLPDETIQCELDAIDDYVEIKFSNYGPYLNEEECRSVFELGKRGRYANQIGKQGSGYGLNFLKSIVDAHCGDIKITSEYGGKIDDIPYGVFTCDIKIPIELPFTYDEEDENDN